MAMSRERQIQAFHEITQSVPFTPVWAVFDKTSGDVLGVALTFRGAMDGLKDAVSAGFIADVRKVESGA